MPAITMIEEEKEGYSFESSKLPYVNRNAIESEDISSDYRNQLRLDLKNIIVAEDQLINIEVLKTHMSELGVQQITSFCINGQEAIDTAKRILEQTLVDFEGHVRKLRPISFMLLDFQMPLKNGIQVLQEVLEIFNRAQLE